MLPQLTDLNKKVALDKLSGVRKMLQEKYNNYLEDFSGSGYNISGFSPIDFGIEGDGNQQTIIEYPTGSGEMYKVENNGDLTPM